GVVGATRPAIEEGWISRAHQVGQSGKIVAPKLYIACGISGATQPTSGMTGSGYVVSLFFFLFSPFFFFSILFFFFFFLEFSFFIFFFFFFFFIYIFFFFFFFFFF
ncbi:FAD-binding protein, partial [Clostridium sp. ZBS17]|uniref:FAD-binding protein n=1 Tax=Clostridium sp. ZBS17 TaxID=2949968 RepID=UPI00207A9802